MSANGVGETGLTPDGQQTSNGPPNGSGLPTRPSKMPPGPPPGPPPGAPSGPSRMSRPGPNFPPRPPLQIQGYPGWGGPPVGRMPMRPPMMPNFPPPLPPGWSEHVDPDITAPDGMTRYYYNSQTKESTYVRPSFAPLPPNVQNQPPLATPPQKEVKKKKEKPKDKVSIPGTTWQRITTTEGNVFYFEKESKKSEWSVPEEIKDQVEELEKEEKRKVDEEREKEEEKKKQERLERLRELERVKLEIEEERKRKAEKRKQLEENGQKEAKRAKVEQNGDDDQEVEKNDHEPAENGDEGADGEEQFGPQDEEDEEAWMKAVAAEFADADKAQQEQEAESKEQREKAEEEAAKKVFAVPEKVNVSLEEQRALFKALLIEKNISPFSPWDQSLPLFINDPRYILLSSTKDRKEVYDEYCRDVGRQRRLNKGSTAIAAEVKKSDPEKEYKALLREDITSTRTRWDDWRKKWKKDRRFYSFGRDDREREKLFKTHLKELGERKRADAQRAEEDFFELLSEQPNLSSSSTWSEAKKPISSDPRYDAVGSSSLREELYQSYIKKMASGSSKETPEQAAERKLAERKAKQEASLKERQAQVIMEKEKVDKDVGRSRAGAGREEGERLFGSLLVDQVRSETSWTEASAFLQSDLRFNHPSLSVGDKRRLFEGHIARLAGKKSNALYALFADNTPSLDTSYSTIYPKIIDDPIVQRLILDVNSLEDRWNDWKKQREEEARSEFDVMLGENSFVEFWGRMRKKVLDEAALNVKEQDEMEEGEGMGDGGAADLTKLAQQIDLDEIKSVLRRDKRYRQFDHMPIEREQWLREYLENLEAASGSKTVHTVKGLR